MLAKVKLILLLSCYYHSFILASCGQDLYKRLNRIGQKLIRKCIYNLFLVFTLFCIEKRKTRNVFTWFLFLHCLFLSVYSSNLALRWIVTRPRNQIYLEFNHFFDAEEGNVFMYVCSFVALWRTNVLANFEESYVKRFALTLRMSFNIWE